MKLYVYISIIYVVSTYGTACYRSVCSNEHYRVMCLLLSYAIPNGLTFWLIKPKLDGFAGWGMPNKTKGANLSRGGTSSNLAHECSEPYV